MPNERSEVQSQATLPQLVEPRPDLGDGAAAIPGDNRGHAIQEVIVAARNLLYRAFDMGVNVNESRGNHAAIGVDHAERGCLWR